MSEVVVMTGITKNFPGVRANDGVDLSLKSGEVHSIVGENGAGKTTLMRILYGMYTPDSGSIAVRGHQATIRNVTDALGLGIGMVHQNFMQIPSLSVLENIVLGRAPVKKLGFIDYSTARQQVSDQLSRLGMSVPLDLPVGKLSVGKRQKVEIAKALYRGADVLILDEPTAVLTPQEARELFAIVGELTEQGKSIVFISHKLQEVMEISDAITVMRHGKVVARLNPEETDEAQLARLMVGKQSIPQVSRSSARHGDIVLRVCDLWSGSPKALPAVRGVNLQIRAGEILGIGGVDGNGQGELVELLVGMRRPHTGQIMLSGKDIAHDTIRRRRELGIGFVPEDRMTTGLAVDAGIEDNALIGAESTSRFSRGPFLRTGSISNYVGGLIDEFDIRGARPGIAAGSLSGGNMQKIILSRELGRDPQLLVVAQPTRGLDIAASMFVRQVIMEQKKRGAAVLLVTADLGELLALSDRIVIMYEGQIAGEIPNVADTSEEELGLLMGGARADYA